MGIMYDPMTGEPIETDDVTTVEDATEVDKSVEENDIAANNEDDSQMDDFITEDEVVEDDMGCEETTPDVSFVSNDETTPDVSFVSNDETAPNAGCVSNDETDSMTDDTVSVTVDDNEVDVRTPIGYDSMTGQPIYDDGSDGGNKQINKKIIGIIGAVVAIILIIIFGIISGAFLSKRAKVEKAIAATFDVKSELYNVTKKAVNIASGNSVKFEYDIEVEDEGAVSGSLVIAGKDKQVSMKADIDSIPEFTVRAGIDSKTVSAEVPGICDKLFVYDYTDSNKDGLLVETLGDNVDSVDTVCKIFYNITDKNKDLQKKFSACFAKHVKELEFESVDSKKFKVNDKKVECKGYSTTIDEDFCVDLLEDIEDIYLDEMEDVISTIEEISGESFKQEFRNLKKEFKGMDDIEMTFYIYKGKLAAIHTEAGKDEVDVLFRGGDYRAQNIIIEENGDEILSFSGSTKKDKEIYKIVIDGDEVEIEYNMKKGRVSIEAGREEFDFALLTSGNSITISFDDVEDVSGEIILSKDAKIEAYENTDKFDVGNADKYDFEDLLDSIDQSDINSFTRLF